MNRVPLINLLPWRQLRQIRQNEQFRRALLMVLMASVLLVGVAYAYQKHHLNHQAAINDDIKARTARLDDDIAQVTALENEQKALFEKVILINDLKANRVALVRFFEQLAHKSDGLVYFKQLSHAGDTLTISGVAKNTAAVSQFAQVAQVAQDDLLDDVMVTSLQDSPDGAWVNFVMTARLDLTATQAPAIPANDQTQGFEHE